MLSNLLRKGREATRSGKWEEALECYDSAYALVGDPRDAGTAAEVSRLIGVVHHQRGHLERARAAYDRSLRIAEEHGIVAEIAAALICIAASEQHCGRIESAAAVYERAEALTAQLGDEALAATIEHNLGVLANIRGDIQGALRRYRSALARHQRLGDELKVLGALNNIGMAYVDLEKWRTAARFFNEAAALAERLGDRRTAGSIEVNRTELHLRAGRFTRARICCDRAFEIFSRLESDSGLAEVYKFYGMLYRETGKPQLAQTHFESAVRLARASSDRLLEAESIREWAVVDRNEGRNKEAVQRLNEAHKIFTGLHADRDLMDLDQRLDSLEIGYLEVVRNWGESIESKDRYTAGHCERVASYACMLAEAIGIPARDLNWLRMGGYLHDVGKIAVPAELLNKAGKLSAEEWTLMQSHTTEGDRIVADLDFPWDIRSVVRSHHERWDGSGYPDGLQGEGIPLVARILCLADVYDALTTTRSYRPAMSRAEALEIMEGDVARIFDPALFPTFRALVEQLPIDEGARLGPSSGTSGPEVAAA